MRKQPKVKRRKRWQFGWCDAASPPANGDDHDWKTKTFRCNTFEQALDRMLVYVRGKPFEVLVDYECAALHVRYSPARHDAHFHRIDRTDHALTEYVG